MKAIDRFFISYEYLNQWKGKFFDKYTIRMNSGGDKLGGVLIIIEKWSFQI